MEKGEIRELLQTTQPEQPTEPFVEEALAQLAQDLHVDLVDLQSRGVFITAQQLRSRHAPDIESDDRITIIWYGDEPAAISLETRNRHNNVRTQQVYFGPRKVDGA